MKRERLSITILKVLTGLTLLFTVAGQHLGIHQLSYSLYKASTCTRIGKIKDLAGTTTWDIRFHGRWRIPSLSLASTHPTATVISAALIQLLSKLNSLSISVEVKS